MDPALSVLDRALKGDAGALSFLERTAGIYVYDGTNPGQPKTCGAWDFLNQALTEVERYESRIMSSNGIMNANNSPVNLEAHVQLLATMSRRAARRCPASDQNLVQICLNNAAHFHGSTEHAKHLIDFNKQMRERVMGRIAAIAFDFTNHRTQRSQQHGHGVVYYSAFSNPVAMDSLCGVVAANAISTGPHEFINLVQDWIVPSKNNLPPFSVASIIYHLASEAIGKSAPAGTRDAVKKIFDPVVSKVLAPMLQEAVRESEGDRASSHRIAAMTLKALESWCATTSCSICKLKQICQRVSIKIIDTISDAMYSDSELVMDALSELLDTLLRQHAEDKTVLEGLSIAENFLKAKSTTAFQNLATMQEFEKGVQDEMRDRDLILSELVSAVGLQRFRFSSRLSNGDSGVCRCLASIARSISIASRSLLQSSTFQGAGHGMIDLLMKATSHPSLNVYSLALDAFTNIINGNSDISTRLLPMLQGKAIVPPSIVGITSDDGADIDLSEFERFREYQLSDILMKCYISCRSYFIESCSLAIEEFCTGATNVHTPFQMEAALFCLCSISVDASKRALLVNASTAAQIAAAKACASLHPGSSKNCDVHSIDADAKHHDEKLARCIMAIAKSPIATFNNPLFISQLCRFIGKYANWVSKTPSEGVLEAAAHLALTCFNEATSKFGKRSEIIEEMTVSPFTEATLALRNILSRAPATFANTNALSTLESGWRSIYDANFDENTTARIDDRKALCTGITRVVAVLPPDQWALSLSSQVSPTIQCIEMMMKGASLYPTSIERAKFEENICRMSEEISVLAIALRTFNTFAKKNKSTSNEGVKAPLLSLLHRVWPTITTISKNFSSYEVVVSSLSDFLLVVVSLNEDGENLSLITEAVEIAIAILDASTNQKRITSSINPILNFVEETIDTFGHQAEVHAIGGFTSPTTPLTETMHKIVQRMVQKSFSTIPATSENRAQEDILPGIFAICRACIRRCPVLLMTLSYADGNFSQSMFAASLGATVSAIGNRQAEVVRDALLYLNDCFLLVTPSNDSTRNNAASMALRFVQPLREELIIALIAGACGLFPREVLDPAGSLLHSILKSTEASDAERICISAVQKETFRVGDNARHTVLLTLGRGTQGTIAASVLMDLLDDLWSMHQNDETGGTIAGGDTILSFTKKYGEGS